MSEKAAASGKIKSSADKKRGAVETAYNKKAPIKSGVQYKPGSNSRQTRRHSPKYNSKSSINYSTYQAIPLYLIVSLIPLILFLKEIVVTDPGSLYWDGQSTHMDIFSYYKMYCLLLFTAIELLLFLFIRKDHPFNTPKRVYYIPSGTFAIFVLLSALASDYRQVAFYGFLERYEGAFVLISYALLVFLAMNILKEEKQVRILFAFLLTSAAVVAMLGALQYFGVDYFKADFFVSLITPASLKDFGGKLTSKFPEKTIFSTLYNSNYVGSYTAMLLPVILVMLISAKKLTHRILLAVLLCPVFICWIGCDSRAGLAGGALAFIVILVMFRKKILQHKVTAIATVVLLFGGLAIFNFATDGSVVTRLKRIATLENKEDSTAAESRMTLDKSLEGLLDVSMSSSKVNLITEKGIFQVVVDGGKLNFSDEKNKELAASLGNNAVTFSDNRFQNIRLNLQPENGLIEFYYNDYQLFDVVFTSEGLKSTSNRWMTYRDNKEIESFGFEGMETFGSNRGYIWSRTLPLLKDTILIGHGPDTFPIYFPQYDFLSKLKFYGTGGIFVDKPHNMYLQTALNTGIASLLALLALFGIYFVSSIRIYIKEDFTTYLPMAGLACFAAFCGYAVAGVFNDSVVSVAPVFWVLLGMGIGINIRLAGLKKENKK